MSTLNAMISFITLLVIISVLCIFPEWIWYFSQAFQLEIIVTRISFLYFLITRININLMLERFLKPDDRISKVVLFEIFQPNSHCFLSFLTL